MSFFEHLNWAYSVAGLAVGMLVGMTGVGGGSLMTPLLIMLFGIHPATAVGTDLLYAAATKTGGTLFHNFGKTVDWRVVRRLATGSIPTSAATLTLLSIFDVQGGEVQSAITQVLAAALFATAIALIFRKKLLELSAKHIGELSGRRTLTLTIIVGALLGVLVSITSVGAGALGVTALIALYPRYPTVRIVGSDIAHAVPLTLFAGLGHWLLGSVDFVLLGSLLIGSLPGILIGSYIAGRVPDVVLRIILAVTLLVVAVRLVL